MKIFPHGQLPFFPMEDIGAKNRRPQTGQATRMRSSAGTAGGTTAAAAIGGAAGGVAGSAEVSAAGAESAPEDAAPYAFPQTAQVSAPPCSVRLP